MESDAPRNPGSSQDATNALSTSDDGETASGNRAHVAELTSDSPESIALAPEILEALRETLESASIDVSDHRRVWPPNAERLAFGKFENRTGYERYLRIISVKWVASRPAPPISDEAKRKGHELGGWGFDVREDVYRALFKEPYLIVDDYDSDTQPPVMFGPGNTRLEVPDSWLRQRLETARFTGFKIRSKIVIPIIQSGERDLWGVLFVESHNDRINLGINDWETFRRITAAFCAPFRLANVLIDADGRIVDAQAMVSQIVILASLMILFGAHSSIGIALSVLWSAIAGMTASVMYLTRETDITFRNLRALSSAILTAASWQTGLHSVWNVVRQRASKRESRLTRRLLLLAAFVLTSGLAAFSWINELLLWR